MTRKAIGGLLSDVGIAGGLVLVVILVQPPGPIGQRPVVKWHEMTVAREVKRAWRGLARSLRLDSGSAPARIVRLDGPPGALELWLALFQKLPEERACCWARLWHALAYQFGYVVRRRVLIWCLT